VEQIVSEIVDFAGNDYLGLARHPGVVRALQEAASRYGVSSTASRWSIGWTDVHEQLERELACFCGTQDACIFGSAYLGGAIYFGQMAALGRRIVFCDEMVHSSQYMGMRSAGLEIRAFRHLDAEDLERQTAGYTGSPAIIATDGVYGISGEVAPLADLARVAEAIEAALFVDDAHGFGILGETGRGTAELFGVDPGRVTVLASLSKALGTYGGVLAGGKQLIDACRRSPEASGSSVPPPPVAAAALAALDQVRRQPSLRRTVFANAARMREMLAAAGIGVVCDKHPIVAMLLAHDREAAALSRHFLAHGIRIPYFHYASEPRHNLLRSVARAIHTEEHLRRFAEAIRTRPPTRSR
jgi:7-keto-8-aminopelargonate synthetase-like enzyme